MKEAINLLKTLEENGYEAYLVGGVPRNYYLKLPFHDFDICTNATPEECKKIFQEVDDRFAQYGNVRIKNFEITTFRREENYQNHRKPLKIEYVSSLKEDLKRRDFIMNTLCLNSNMEYVDYLGARKDLDEKIIRSVGNAEEKLEEDALRILRAIRFACTLDFQLEESLKQAILKKKHLLKSISYERKKEELNRIFLTKNGISMLLEFHMEEDLELPNLKQALNCPKEDIWIILDVFDRYPFSKKERFK